MISILENLCESNEKLITKRMLNKVAKHTINYKTSIVLLFVKNRHLENTVNGSGPSLQQNPLGTTIILKCETLIKNYKLFLKDKKIDLYVY